MNNVDLNISNYDFNDIINLFKLKPNFDEMDMKRAKQIVLMTHPDKSFLPAKYFLFYSQAYKLLLSIHEFKNKSTKKMDENIEYTIDDNDKDKNEILTHFFNKNENLKNNNNFNKWFNANFDKHKIEYDNDKGYGDWLKSNEDIEPETHISLSQLNNEINKKKEHARSLVVHKDITDYYQAQSIQSTDLTGNAPDNFSSDLFSNLPYQDLRQAHIESVIPVTDTDYHNIKKFNNINEFVSYRNTQNITPLSESQAIDYINKREKNENIETAKRAYELLKQTEIVTQNNKSFWGTIMNITEK